MSKRLKKEYEQFIKLSDKDKEFKSLAEEDEKENAKAMGYFTQEEKSIVGKQAKSKVEDMIKLEEMKTLTTEQKSNVDSSILTIYS